MKRTLTWYIKQMRQMVEKRLGGTADDYLEFELEDAARCKMMLEKIHDQILTSDLTTLETGSMGQQKEVVNPLLATYDKLHRTMLMHYEALGLNFRANPEKVRGGSLAAEQKEARSSPMTDFFARVRGDDGE